MTRLSTGVPAGMAVFHRPYGQGKILQRVAAICVLLLLAGHAAFGQAFPIFNGTVNTCQGAFLDSGGEGAVGYSDNENFTYTICPDTPNDAVSLTFLTFNLSTAGAAPLDQMTIYDGSSTAATSLGSYSGTALQGITVNASPLNNTGCLTIVFRSNGTGTGLFAASINCYTPCQRPVAAATMSQADPVKICVGESITFNSAGSSAAPGFNIASRQWVFGDGGVVNNAGVSTSHTYTQEGGFKAQLYLVDNNGCASANRVDLVVMVGTEPDFVGTTGDLLGCTGETLCLEGAVNATTWTEIPGPDLGGGVFLPDEVGACFESEIIFSQFSPGQTLTNTNDLLGICMNMEHSFMGDLVINIISPTGQSVTLHQQGGGGTFLGVPVDNDLTPDAQGECWNYCFEPGATNGTWVDNAGGTLPSGSYESVENLNGLIGSQLNGIWRLQVCDLWGSDNGFQCTWDIDFDPDLYPDLLEFTPIYGAACDSSYWTGPGITSTSAACDEICVSPAAPGTYPYVYHVKDDFGCTYDTTLNVTIVAPPVVNAGADVTTCGTPVPLNATMTTPGLPGACTYELRLFDSYGDGWDGGAHVTVTVDGISTSYALEDPPGNQTVITFPVLDGDPISLNYTMGSIWNDENRFALRNSAGTVLHNSGWDPASGLAWSGTVSCPPEPFSFTWSPAAGLSSSTVANPTATVASTTVYCVTASQPSHPNCTATDCVTITVDNGVDPGTNGTITVCENAGAIDLFGELGGAPTTGGTWTGPTNAAHSSTFIPGSDTPGVYTYHITGSAACGGATETSTVTVAVNPLPDAGSNGALAVCSSSGPQNLINSLGGTPDAGGSWTGPVGAFSGTFNPATHAAGVYTYTVTGTAPCPSASATVTVLVSTPPDPGTNGTITLCSSDAPASLEAQLGGTPDAGGTWSGPSAVVSGMINPATMSAGVYTYTVAGTAPCPDETATVTVTINTPPDPGTNGTITLCSSDAPASLLARLGGTPDAGGTWSGPSAVVGGMIDPATMSAGVYTYTVAGTAPCPDETATVTVTINSPPDPGTDGTITLCSSDAPASLLAQLGGTPDAGGTWSGPSAVAGGMIDPETMSAGVYTYTVAGTAPCPDESATVTVTINTPPDAGTNGTITLCSSDAPASLLAQLGGTPDAGGTWSGPSAVVGGMIDPETMSAGVYTYTVAGTAPCPDESATVTVTINTPPDAGTNGTITLCSSDAPASLLAQLGGTPDAGGTWSGPSAVVGGMINPATMSAGVYTYTVAGTAPCPDETATVTVTINSPPDPGTDGTITLCSSDAPTSLLAQLGGTPDAGGTWSGPSAVVGGMINPATMSAGVYTYTVAGTAPCPDETATVTVTINSPPDPGTDGTITLCSSDAPTSLLAQLGGTPDAGGTWSGPSAVVGGMINPATMSAGVYTYTVAGTAPCPDETATVTVTINTPPGPGTNGTITLCSSDAPASLLAQLGGTPDAGGTWSGPSTVVGGMIDPATMGAGVYTYTVVGTAPCPNETSTVTVTINTPPDPGADAAVALCATSPSTSLFAALGGTPDGGGTWTGPSPVSANMFNPATMNAGDYTYTVQGIPPCVTVSAMVTVNVVTNPDPGTPGAITLCTSAAPIDLFDQINGTPDAGGTWSGPSAVSNGQFDPAAMNAGVYTYTINVPPPCVSVSTTVTVTLVQPPDAGTDGAITLCISSPATSLIASLGGSPDAGGTWTGPSPVTGGSFNPATMAVGTYSYTVQGVTPCPVDVATVDVNVVSAPDAGTPGVITICASDAPFDLFSELNGTPDAGGMWNGPSAIVGGQFDPATMTAGVYTYTISVPPPCVNASSSVTVSVVQPPDAGADGSLTLCISSPATPLMASLTGSPDAGGTWTGPSPVVGGSFNPAAMIAGSYTYTVAGTTPCPADAATVNVNVVAAPDAGTPGSVTICATDAAFDLFSELNGTPDAGGIWNGPSAVVGGQFDPATMTAGVYTYTITVPPPCVNASSTVTVSVVQPPDAGADGSLTLCISSPATPLMASLGGSPDAGGTWTGTSPIVGGSFNPATMNAGSYTYTVAGTTPCPADAATVDVNVVAAPDAGTPESITICATDAAFDLFSELNGTPDAGGIWNGPSAVVGGQFDPATMTAGVYTYTISVPPPCVNASSTVTISVVQPPDAGADGSLTLCISSPPTPLMASLTGSPDAGGTWTGPSPIVGGSFNPAAMSVGTYTYTVNGISPCPADAASVLVDVVAAPDAGLPAALALCSTDEAVDLFATLNGTPDAGGAWSGPSAVSGGLFDPTTMQAGVYTYTITVPPPCVNASSTVTIAVADPPNAGIDGGLTLCATSAAEALITGLGGTPDAGGVWNGPSVVVAGLFDPAIMNMGVYTYTVNGTSPCPADAATVEVNVVDNPDPGGPGFITLCATDAAVDMFTWIEGTPDAGGTWTRPSTSVADELFDPAVDPPGVYTYTLTVPPPCTSASTTVTVDVIIPPNAGDDGAITLCITSGSTPLFPVLGGSPDTGGTWTRPNGTAFTGDFTPASDTAGEYTYTVAGISPCPANASTVVVNVVTDPDPGIDGTLTLCSTDAPSALFNSLGGTPDIGGTWSAPDGTAFSGTFDPGTDAIGVYTYTIEAPAPCSNVSSTVTVSVVQPPDAGDDGALIVCGTGASVDLFGSLQGQPDQEGSWTFTNNAFSGTFDPSADLEGTYTYSVAGTTPCPNDAASVQVSITEEPNAGHDAILNLCVTGDPVDVFPSLGGADAGGTWTAPDASNFTGTFTPGTSTPGDYMYQVTGTAPCPNASAIVTVTQLSEPDAGEDGAITLCSTNAPVTLFDLLGGTPDPGGTWLDASGQVIGDQFDPSVQYAGTLTYLLTVPPPCVNDTSLVVINVVQAANPGEDATTASCANGGAIDLFATLNGEPDAGGTWTGPSALSNALFMPETSEPGTYTYTVSGVAPCPNVTADVTVAVEALPDAGADGGTTVCPEAPPVDLFGLLGGTPDANGIWTAPNGTSNNGTFDPATDEPGAYTYTVTGTLCPEDQASSTVTIYAVPEPNAGPDAISCNLKYMLSATGTWASGSWSGPSGAIFGDIHAPETEVTFPGGGAQTFTWNTLTAEGCASEDEVTIIFTKPMEGAATTSDAICHGSCDGTATVNATGGNIGEYFYIWSGGVAGNVPEAIGLCAGSYNVIVADTNGCNVVVAFNIAEPAPLVIDAVSVTPETCPGSCDGTLTVLDSEGAVFIMQSTQQNSPTFTGLCAGTFPVIMHDANGCTATASGTITSPPPVLAGFTFSPDTIFVSDPTVHFINTSSANAVSFTWTFGNESTSTEENPAFVFPDRQADIYEVCLTARDANGCPNQICLPLPIYDVLLVHVPNAFSPNGDGHNDVFLPVFNLPQVKDYQFMVFNRWGEQIFNTDLPGKPWDGNYSGVLSQVDVYVWKLSCKDALSGELIERVGHVTIVQ